MSIAVVIPAYNVDGFLAEAINSVLSQSLKPDEIIVVDDCSTDNTLAVADSFRHFGVQVILTHMNSGGAAARNLGISYAKSDLIAMLDGDDFWLSDHLKELHDLIQKHPGAGVAYSMTRAFGNENWLWKTRYPEDTPSNHLFSVFDYEFPAHNNVLMRKKIFHEVGGYNSFMRVAQDFDLWLRMSHATYFVCTHSITSMYRKRNDGVSTVHKDRYTHDTFVSSMNFLMDTSNDLDKITWLTCHNIMMSRWIETLADMYHSHNKRGLQLLLSLNYDPRVVKDYRHKKRLMTIRKMLYSKSKTPFKLRQRLMLASTK